MTLVACAPLAAAPEHVRIATVVTDHQGRAVSGLTLKDFELREDGIVQKLDSVEPRSEGPRRFAILLDEFHVDAADSARVREAVTSFVSSRLRAGDELAVVKPLDPLTAIHLTADRDAAQRAIASFEGRDGVYEPRSAIEEETMGRAPVLVEANRAQVVLSALRALTAQLGTGQGRSAILLVSNGFAQARRNVRGLPDAGVVERFANLHDVPIYAFDPRGPAPDRAAAPVMDTLVMETGGTVFREGDLSANLSRAAAELDTGYTLTYTPAHGEDGKFHPVQVSVVRAVLAKAGADARSRAGYISATPPELRLTARTNRGPILSTRLLHKSPLIDVWSGVTRVDGEYGHVTVTWGPGGRSTAPVRVALKAATSEGKLLFEGFVSPVQLGEPPNPANPDRAEFEAPPGRVEIDMTILGGRGEKLDVDARDLEVPAPKGDVPLILPPVIISTRSAKEFREVSLDANAAPDPAQQFRRTDRLVIRVPAYASGQPVAVTAKLLNRVGQPMHALDPLPATPGGITQFDLLLAPLAPGDYFLVFTVPGPSGPIDKRVPFKITG
jgi:VWFA-related protein